MVKCSSDTDKAHISESSATVIVVLLLLQYHCPPNLELHQHLSRACAGQFLVHIYNAGSVILFYLLLLMPHVFPIRCIFLLYRPFHFVKIQCQSDIDLKS